MNQILQKTEQEILAKANPQLVPVIQKVTDAGRTFMYADQNRELLAQQLSGDGAPEDLISEGVAKLIGVLYNQSKKTLPMQVMVPASTIILCDVLDMLEQAGKVQVTPEFLASCMKSLSGNILRLFGVGPEQMQKFFDKAKAGGGIPQSTPQAGGLIQQARGAQ